MTVEPDTTWAIPDGAGRHRGIGVVGAGGIVSGAHLPAYRQAGLRVVAIFDIDQARAQEVAQAFAIERVAGSVAELLETPGVEIVDIAVPAWAQPAIVSQVAAAGRHMLCQKPLALDYPTALAEVETAEAAGVLLAVNQQMRWDAGVAASRGLIRAGALGTVEEVWLRVSVVTPWHMWPWLAASPRLDISWHSIHYHDAMRSLLGDPVRVTSVHGRSPQQGEVQGETATTTVMEFDGGARAIVAVNHYDTHGTPISELRILGTDGMLEGTIGVNFDYPTGRPDTLALYREGRKVRDYPLDTRWIPDAFLGPMADLMDAIEMGRAPVTSGRDNLRTIALVEAIYRSAAEHRSVTLDEITGEA